MTSTDWDQVRAWVGTAGGIAGLASLVLTRLDRHKAEREAQLKRLRLEVTRLQASIEVQLAFTSDEVHQAFEAEVERLAPEDTLLIALVRKQVPGGGVRNEVGSARSLPRQVLPLAR